MNKTKPIKYQISFETTAEESEIIARIAVRAGGHIPRPVIEINMDVTATHCNGCPLRLQQLLDADDFNFLHDIVGIQIHLNRVTGKLENCFLPRFAK